MISVKNLKKSYNKTSAVDGVSFEVKESSSTALLGPNGAGKTTIVKMLLDFTKPDSGSLFINNIPAYSPQARSGIGYMPENIKIPGHLSGLQFVTRNAILYCHSSTDARNMAKEALATVDMESEMNKKSAHYSKGMRQRVGLAAALVNKPHILILDEPVAGLDPLGVRSFRNILLDRKKENTTILLNSHILSEVEKICDHSIILNRGRIATSGKIEEIVSKEDTLEDVLVRSAGGGLEKDI